MNKVILIVVHNNTIEINKFNSITDAYVFYLKEFSTLGEWWYYFKLTHKLLNHIYDENIMLCIFRNVFDENVYLVVDKE